MGCPVKAAGYLGGLCPSHAAGHGQKMAHHCFPVVLATEVRQAVWLDKHDYRVLKIDFFDRKNSLLKTFAAADYHQYLGKYWRAHEMDMVNHQNGKSTRLLWSDFEFRAGLENKDFNKNSLKRVR